jgi:hypothetical protein
MPSPATAAAWVTALNPVGQQGERGVDGRRHETSGVVRIVDVGLHVGGVGEFAGDSLAGGHR